jgi:hypothetical protein
MIPKALKRAVWERDQSCCVVCGLALSLDYCEAHHRLYKSRGGKDELANLITVCQNPCHTERIHKSSARAVELGWAISRYDKRTPDEIPVLYADGEFRLLKNDLEQAA